MPRNRSEKETPAVKATRAYRDILARYIKACDNIGFDATGNKYYMGENQVAADLRVSVIHARNYSGVPHKLSDSRWVNQIETLDAYLEEHS